MPYAAPAARTMVPTSEPETKAKRQLGKRRAARRRPAARTSAAPAQDGAHPRPRGNAELAEDLLGVVARGEGADAEPLRDLAVGAPLAQQPRDGDLPLGQP